MTKAEIVNEISKTTGIEKPQFWKPSKNSWK